jgi:hypothetical protein
MKNCANRHTKGGVARIAMIPAPLYHSSNAVRVAVRASDLSMPAHFLNMFDTCFLGRELFVNLDDVHRAVALPLCWTV